MQNEYRVVYQLRSEGIKTDGEDMYVLERADFDTDEDFCLALASNVLEDLRADRKLKTGGER